MNNKLELIKKIRSLSTYALFACIVLSFWISSFNLISNLFCSVLYITSFLEYKLKTKKTNWLLLVSCTLAVFFLIFNYFYTIPFGRAIGLFFIYFYLNISSKIKTGKWNKWFIGLGVVGVSCNIINNFIDSGWVSLISLVLQIILILKFVDPILEKIALEHREKRLANEKKENVVLNE